MPPTGKAKSYLIPGLAFAVGMAVAFLAAWLWFSPAAPSAPVAPASSPAARELTPADLAPFLDAARNSDFAAMRDVGSALLREGARLPGAADVLAEYATNSFPPYTVYAFYSAIGPDSTRRVLLTLEGERVVSFMAEEMEIVQ